MLLIASFPPLGSGIPEIKAVLSGFEIPYLLDLRVLGMCRVFHIQGMVAILENTPAFPCERLIRK